jgi:hypothetical protein
MPGPPLVRGGRMVGQMWPLLFGCGVRPTASVKGPLHLAVPDEATEGETMTSVDASISKDSVSKNISQEEFRRLVGEAAKLLRLRPVPGSDPQQAEQWLRRVAEFLQSSALRQVLYGLGVEAPTDFGKPSDQSAVATHLADSLDTDEDSPLLLIPLAVEAAYIGLVGYAIYTHYSHHE